MKKMIIVLACVFAMNVGSEVAMAANEAVYIAQSGQYCPPDKVCLATNMTASAVTGQGSSILRGISIYQIGEGQYVAIVPEHGQLSLYEKDGNWCFDANGRCYQILNWKPRN